MYFYNSFVHLSDKRILHKALIIIYVDVHTVYKNIICITNGPKKKSQEKLGNILRLIKMKHNIPRFMGYRKCSTIYIYILNILKQ